MYFIVSHVTCEYTTELKKLVIMCMYFKVNFVDVLFSFKICVKIHSYGIFSDVHFSVCFLFNLMGYASDRKRINFLSA